MPNHSIYALCEPDTDEVRYVGRTSYPLRSRLNNHVANARNPKFSENKLVTWIVGVLATGKKPKIVLLEECDPRDVGTAERTWIATCAQNGCNMLNEVSLPAGYSKERHNRKRPLKRQTPDWSTRRNVTLPAEAVDFIADVARAQHMPIYQLVIEAVQLYALYRNPPLKSDNHDPA